ncbi:glycoside hydrolase family 17 protein [Lophiostoma macrostomum CBS 122681]|uniref:Probable beta-glucosidase btgE n=1 Tax=Lophiostoma macrostomum CBS 122681 TaxID=1314788 RepID=A0A6A6ST18_9PLEO|nr:glycoside hydrolase family 17 protein [Lophiostoma macrostomum CBS 122681]
MKTSIVASAALVGSVAASAHAGFHFKRHDHDNVCTVYTTVYVYPSEIPAPVANSTVYVIPSAIEPSTSLPAYTPETSTETSTEVYYAPTSTEEAYVPTSTAEVYVPTSSAEAYVPKSSSKVEVYVPASSSKVEIYSAPAYSAPAYGGGVSVSAYEAKPSHSASYGSSSSSSSSGSTGSYAATGRIVTKGGKWAITYTPYTSEGECKSASEVQGDIAKIAEMGFTTIRSYSTDCGVFENVVPTASEHGLKVIYGIFLEGGGSGGKGPGSSYANDQLQEIIDNAPKDSVALLLVGNEAIFNGYTTAEELAVYIDEVREKLQGAGFPKEIAVSTTEPVDIWESYGAALCDHIDLFAAQVHPFFTSKVSASEAGSFAKEQLEQAAAVCPEAAAKGKYITEIGWPSAGEANGNAIPGVSEQKEAIESILKEVGEEACIFSFQNDLWKAPGAFSVEQSFGCSDVLLS